MELRMSLNFVPLLSLFAFLLSLRTDPGRLLFGPEVYEGELALWGVLFRLFCLAAFFRFRVLWPVVAYSVIYAALGPRLGRMVELVSFGLFATFLGGYRDALIKNFYTDVSIPSPSTPISKLPWTPFSGTKKKAKAADSTRRESTVGGARARSKSPAAPSTATRKRVSGTPVALEFEKQAEKTPVTTHHQTRQTSPRSTTSSSAGSVRTGATSSALEQLKQQKRKEMELRAASKGKKHSKCFQGPWLKKR